MVYAKGRRQIPNKLLYSLKWGRGVRFPGLMTKWCLGFPGAFAVGTQTPPQSPHSVAVHPGWQWTWLSTAFWLLGQWRNNLIGEEIISIMASGSLTPAGPTTTTSPFLPCSLHLSLSRLILWCTHTLEFLTNPTHPRPHLWASIPSSVAPTLIKVTH